MSSPRQLAIAEAYPIFIAHIAEYLHFRTNLWNTYFQYLLKFIKDTPSERKNDCEEIQKIILATTSDQPEELFSLLIKIGKMAHKAQNEKPQENSVWKYLSSWFIEDNSAFAKMLHSLRTAMIQSIKNSTLRLAYEQKIKTLRAQLESKNVDFANKMAKKLSLTEVEAERDKLVMELIFLGDTPTLTYARNSKLCDIKPIPAEELKLLKSGLPSDLEKKTYGEFPLFLQPHYFQIYWQNEITTKPGREVNFRRAVEDNKNILSKIKPDAPDDNVVLTNEEPDMLTAGFFGNDGSKIVSMKSSPASGGKSKEELSREKEKRAAEEKEKQELALADLRKRLEQASSSTGPASESSSSAPGTVSTEPAPVDAAADRDVTGAGVNAERETQAGRSPSRSPSPSPKTARLFTIPTTALPGAATPAQGPGSQRGSRSPSPGRAGAVDG